MADTTKTNALEKGKSITTPAMKARAKAFEKEVNRQDRQLRKERAARVKKGGFKSESDYFRNTNPFKNDD